jgi:hypothetical protein
MTTEHDTRTRIVVSWLRDDAHENAERVLLSALNEIDHTRQRRSWWPAWRFSDMNAFAKFLVATAAVVAVAVLGINLLPGGSAGGVPPSPSSSVSTSPEPSPSPRAYEMKPFAGAEGFQMCGPAGVDTDCIEDPRDETITFTFEAPPSWERLGDAGVFSDQAAPPDAAAVTFYRGNWLFSEPCTTIEEAQADVAVGPTVDDLVTALADHPKLDVTTPVDVTLAGYSGTYLDLEVPADISECARYRPIDAHIYAQGPGQRWHMWILDVDGVRVVVETNDYAGTSAERLAEQQAIIDSLEITP